MRVGDTHHTEVGRDLVREQFAAKIGAFYRAMQVEYLTIGIRRRPFQPVLVKGQQAPEILILDGFDGSGIELGRGRIKAIGPIFVIRVPHMGAGSWGYPATS